MKDFFKKWIIPPGYINILKLFKAKKSDIIIAENSNLKNSYNNINRCFILATGPSIKNQDLTCLKDEFCISVSNFFVHPLYNLFSIYLRLLISQ